MIKIINGIQEGQFLSRREYYQDKSAIARVLMPVTKRLRAYRAGKYIEAKESHLDIGCGDGYFMKKSKCNTVYGLDSKYGDFVKDKLHFPDNYFDYVSMLAVLEHIKEPKIIFKEIHRVLKPEGAFVFTTPKKISEALISTYVKDIKDNHVRYYDLEAVKEFSNDLFNVSDYKTFIFGLNQIFHLKKI